MAEKGEVKVSSLIARTLKDTGEVVDWAGAALPYGSLLGKALKTIPWEDIFDWAGLIYKRYHHGEAVTTPGPAGGEALPPAGNGAQASPTAEATVAVRAMTDLVHSEPFGLAVGEAVAGFPKLLGGFISRTRSGGAGIWPAFSFEQLARLYFRRELGSAAATSVAEVAELVEKGLAGDMLRQLQADVESVQNGSPPGVPFNMSGSSGSGTYLWSVNRSLPWPKVGDLSPGYFTGFDAIVSFDEYDVKKAKEQEKQLLARLGRMSQREVEHLSEAWLSQCDAMIVAPRMWEPLDQNVTQMKVPLFSALLALEKRGVAVDGLRPMLEKMFAALKALGLSPTESAGVIREANRMLDAVAENDRLQFGAAADSLRKDVASDYRFGVRAKANAPTIEEGISSLGKAAGWI
jgi:hypothetical protein